MSNYLFLIFFISLIGAPLSSMEEEDPVDGLLESSLKDLESQEISGALITDNLSLFDATIYRVFSTKIKQKIETHLITHESINKDELKTIVRQEIKQFSVRAGTSFTLLSSYIGLNIFYAYVVGKIPYPAVTTTLYTFQTILGLAIGAPILTPALSWLRNKAFNFREFERSTGVHTDLLEGLWYDTSRQLSMNAEMSRNLVVYFLLILQGYQNNIVKINKNNTNNEVKIKELAKELALFLGTTKTLFPELALDNLLISTYMQNFMAHIIELYSINDCELLSSAVKNEMVEVVKTKSNQAKIMPQILVLKNYCEISLLADTY